VPSLLSNEELKEERKDSISMPVAEVQRKIFDMRTLSVNRNLEASFKRENSPESKASVVPYANTINYIRVNGNFMLKEELVKTKVFPIREWLATKNKMVLQEPEQESPFQMWKWILVVIGFVVLCVVTVVFFVVKNN
jgi:hypothetical protein